MNVIQYITGDATEPIGDDPKIIAHVCNDVGAWGAGFVRAVSARWSEPERHYRALKNYQLGEVQYILVTTNITVANMIAQHNVGTGAIRIRYGALRECLQNVASYITPGSMYSIHMPRIGCGLAGGSWEEVERIINRTLIIYNIPVFVYDLPK